MFYKMIAKLHAVRHNMDFSAPSFRKSYFNVTINPLFKPSSVAFGLLVQVLIIL
jgi:hypothetical protein